MIETVPGREASAVVLVALTGYGIEEDKVRPFAAGFDYHLVKPVNVDLLGDLVGRIGAGSTPSTTMQ